MFYWLEKVRWSENIWLCLYFEYLDSFSMTGVTIDDSDIAWTIDVDENYIMRESLKGKAWMDLKDCKTNNILALIILNHICYSQTKTVCEKTHSKYLQKLSFNFNRAFYGMDATFSSFNIQKVLWEDRSRAQGRQIYTQH